MGALTVAGEELRIHRIAEHGAARLPYTLRVLLENVLRSGDEAGVRAVAALGSARRAVARDLVLPSRVLLQDFTGVPAVVDLAAMRDAIAELGGDPARINPLIPAELVIDHSVQVDLFASRGAFARNVELEVERNRERYAFLRWGQSSLRDFKVVPPGTGICHQVNLEYLARVVESRDGVAFPDTVVGLDSHTTMVNGLGVLGWGVGGIEAEAAMLGEPLSMLVPQVVGFRLSGRLREGTTATDLVLTATELLRRTGVVGKFVEYFGDGVVEPHGRRPRDAREHVARVRRDVRLLPGRRADARLPAPDRPSPRAGRARRGLLPREPALARAGRASGVLAGRRARPRRRRAVARRPAPPAGPRPARAREAGVPRGAADLRRRADDDDEAIAETFPASDPTTEQAPGGRRQPEHVAVAVRRRRAPARSGSRSTARSTSSGTARS